MGSSSNPPEPIATVPSEDWIHFALYERVKKAILSLPVHFYTETHIEGISATDIFTLNSALGATIEEQVVSTLNRIRSTWDVDGSYSLYGFVRQPQTFPDVLLRRMSSDEGSDDVILGVELKGWYLLSKEGEPSFRYQATPRACADADLLVCVPWALKNVLSGSPAVFQPYMKPAKYAAELRNYHWQHKRATKLDSAIEEPKGQIGPYPSKSDQISDKPVADSGGNFGRYARTGIMDGFKERTFQTPLCGIPARAWLEFFKLFTESTEKDEIVRQVEKLKAKAAKMAKAKDEDQGEYDTLRAVLETIENHFAE